MSRGKLGVPNSARENSFKIFAKKIRRPALANDSSGWVGPGRHAAPKPRVSTAAHVAALRPLAGTPGSLAWITRNFALRITRKATRNTRRSIWVYA